MDVLLPPWASSKSGDISSDSSAMYRFDSDDGELSTRRRALDESG